MKSASRQIVVGLGELLWDVYPDARFPGGAPANVAFHAKQLGHVGVVCSRVGRDEPGDELISFLRARGLESAWIQRDEEKPTGRVTVDTSRPAGPLFHVHENAAWDRIEFDDRLERLMGEASAVCFGTLAQRGPVSRETIHRCLAAAKGALRVYDVNLREGGCRPAWIERSLRVCRIVKLNTEEVDVLGGMLQTGSTDPDVFARVLGERYGVEVTCITRAEAGCLLITRERRIEVPGLKVNAADPVGAGDAFTAALISGFLRGRPETEIAEFANRVGARVAGLPGAMPEMKDLFPDGIPDQRARQETGESSGAG